jgi:uncharacterized membrane protein/predicted heme/steroid binding protein
MLMPLESSIFESVAGLPLHPLIVHVAVVLVPLAALFLIVLVIVPRWAAKYGWIALITLGLGTGAAFVAVESGQALAATIGEPPTHGIIGRIAPWLAVGLFVLALSWLVLQRRSYAKDQHRSGGALVTGVLTAVAALVVVGWYGYVGHSGATAVWGQTLNPTPASASPTPSISPSRAPSETARWTPSPSDTPNGLSFTMAEEAQHANASACWAAVNGQVYDLTSWISQHPGGSSHILALCGTDASAAFNAQHSGQTAPAAELAQFRLGPLV